MADVRRHFWLVDERLHIMLSRRTSTSLTQQFLAVQQVRVSSIHDLAAIVRGRRLAIGLSQAQLAARAGVSRDWVNSFEAGKATVELILVLRILEVLGLRLDVSEPDEARAAGHASSTDLDALLDDYQQP